MLRDRSLARHCVAAAVAISMMVSAARAEHHGQVLTNGLPVPGATVTATQNGKQSVTTTDEQGGYFFPTLGDGSTVVRVEMPGFAPVEQTLQVAPGSPAGSFTLKVLPLDQMRSTLKILESAPIGTPQNVMHPPLLIAAPPAVTVPTDTLAERPSDGLLIQGTENNAATSKYSISQAFGNKRPGMKGLYTGGASLIFDNSATDATPYSLSGINTGKLDYNRVTAGITLGGPIYIPHLIHDGPNFFVAYQWLRNRTTQATPGIVPTLAQRSGDLSSTTTPIVNPATGIAYTGNQVPVSTQAAALLKLYPLPNSAGGSNYNYQVPTENDLHQDALQLRSDKQVSRKDQIFGNFALQSNRNSTTNLFSFVDKSSAIGINSNINWSHRFRRTLAMTLGYQFSRLSVNSTPYWQNRQNVSGIANITGNDQDAFNWGPPTLNFNNFSALSDGPASFNRSQTDGLSAAVTWNHRAHNITAGGDFRRQQFNYFSQTDPRGTLTFTGASSGYDFADFLIGVPTTSSLAFGNADKYLRQGVYGLYATDDWRINSQLTFNYGVRWEYGAPITELKNRLVNLDVASGFAAVAPVLASAPQGALSGQQYPSSLLRPDRQKIEPRIGFSWRPFVAGSMVVRGGYGVYSDTSVYQATALLLAQQSPLSKTLSVQNSAACLLTLANPFITCANTVSNTFAVDPNFRVGYAQVWRVGVQQDLPGALQVTATYVGTKGTRGVQQFLPNTNPIGAAAPCPQCPRGFQYRTSNGNSTRESGDLQVRRRLKNGFTATAQYTYSKSIDNDYQLGGRGAVSAGSTTGSASPLVASTLAQDWRNLRGERGLSSFDQRHLLAFTAQYTTGQGIGGGTLLSGWRATALKEWSVVTTINTGSGLPETPVYPQAVPGTGVVGSIRPNVTGASIYAAPANFYLNPAAFSAPLAGQWGNARRNSIIGPKQFTLNASLARTFRLNARCNLDARVDATNLLNKVTFTGYNTAVGSTQFGLPVAANAMRSLQTTLRVRF